MLCMANFFSEKNTCMTAFKPNSELEGTQHDQNPYPIHNPWPQKPSVTLWVNKPT